MIIAAIFDMDGTLADSVPMHFAIWKKILAGYGVQIEYDEWKPFIGKLGDIFIKHLEDERGISLNSKKLIDEKRAVIKKIYVQKIDIFPGVKELLQTLQDGGCKLAIASSEWHNHIIKFLSLNCIERYFSIVLGREDIKNHKPDPDVYLRTAKKLGVNPMDCVVFEDSIVGVEAAKRAGMKCIAIETTFSGKELAQADLVVKNLGEKEKIMEFIRKN
ncbi:MAG: HAD family phosphatase [Nanoarchaeota archaeon]|nr:HAD family phosphatase [Nanoarchaeota archaeon]